MRRRGAPLLAGLALLAGCAGGPAPHHHYYRLEPSAPPARLATPKLDGVLVVDRLQAEAIASGRALLERGDAALAPSTGVRVVDQKALERRLAQPE